MRDSSESFLAYLPRVVGLIPQNHGGACRGALLQGYKTLAAAEKCVSMLISSLFDFYQLYLLGSKRLVLS